MVPRQGAEAFCIKCDAMDAVKQSGVTVDCGMLHTFRTFTKGCDTLLLVEYMLTAPLLGRTVFFHT